MSDDPTYVLLRRVVRAFNRLTPKSVRYPQDERLFPESDDVEMTFVADERVWREFNDALTEARALFDAGRAINVEVVVDTVPKLPTARGER